MKAFKFIIFILIISLNSQLISGNEIRKITVTGKSERIVQPHYAILELESEFIEKNINLSYSQTEKALFDLRKALNNNGIIGKAISQSLIRQGAEYDENAKIRGYYSRCSIEIKVDELKKLSKIYEILSNYNCITIRNTEYKRNDYIKIRNSEYINALLAAREKAEFMAKTLNATIGKVHSIEELGSSDYKTRTIGSNVSSEMIDSIHSLLTGLIKIAAVVRVEFELK